MPASTGLDAVSVDHTVPGSGGWLSSTPFAISETEAISSTWIPPTVADDVPAADSSEASSPREPLVSSCQ